MGEVDWAYIDFLLRKHANTPNWKELSLPHVHLLLTQVGEYKEWIFKISAMNAAIQIFGGEDSENNVNEPGTSPTLDDVAEFQRFARGAD